MNYIATVLNLIKFNVFLVQIDNGIFFHLISSEFDFNVILICEIRFFVNS